MTKNYFDLLFNLNNDTTRKLTIKDVRDDITSSEITAFVDLLIEKNAHINGHLITSLEKCTKYTVDEEVII